MSEEIKEVIESEERKGRVIRPYCHSMVKELLTQTELLLQLTRLHHGPVHLVLPQIMDENITRMNSFFEAYEFETAIHYTMKPNKSDVFARQAFKNGINIDVSSLAELQAALGAGFKGEQIGCTNTKNRQYLWLALQHDCLISIDNQLELELIIEMASQRREANKPIRLLLRIADLQPLDRQFKSKSSKFGIPVGELPNIYNLLREHPVLSFEGFHFHNDNRLGDLQGAYVEHVLRLMEEAHTQGFEPEIINIGGGMRDRLLEDPNEWAAFLELIEKGLILHQETHTWHGHGYGMTLNDRGRVSGREKIQGNMSPPPYNKFLTEALEHDQIRERPLNDIIAENLYTLMVEPGNALLQQCGITLLPVKGVKLDSDGNQLLMVDANVYNISSWNIEPLADPVIISKDQNSKQFEAYLIDNVCNERGLLGKRKITFDHTPSEGDLVCFINTAAYVSDFEDASPHRHPRGAKFVIEKNDNGWSFCSEDQYWPF